MSEPNAKPTPREMILWAIPTLCALAFTFIIRYGGRTIETPDQ